MSKKSTNSLLAFLTGAATGALLGILFAPDTGANTRDKLSFKLDQYKKMLEDLIDDLIQGKEIPVTAAKSEGEKVVSDAKERAEQLLADVDELIGHIKSGDKEVEN
ncbi:MAG: YtxH domain-containing protein [Cyclobacteriaceae bacterium]|nr:YtxH domain-containing protein [Cyclobacteriaceae bacterium]